MEPWPKHMFRVGASQGSFADPPPSGELQNLRDTIEPWLTAVFQSEHLSVLLGSGFSSAIAACGGQAALKMDRVSFAAPGADKVDEHATTTAKAANRGPPNVEDQLRAALAYYEGLRIGQSPEAPAWNDALNKVLKEFTEGVLEAEERISKCLDDAGGPARGALLQALMSFASRAATRERVHIFTTNYDRVVEHGCDLLGLRLIDRFVGSLVPEYRASRQNVDLHYNPPGVRGEPRYLEGVIRLTKLHGSIDWRLEGHRLLRRPLPFGAPTTHSECTHDPLEQCMIYPNAAKDYETLFFPYAELFRDFAAATCQPNSTLVTYGYGFGDDHINRVIRDMLTLPSTHLVIISWDEAGGRLQRFHDSLQREAQVSVLLGPHFGDLPTLVEHYLPKPAIDPITFRREALLQRRGDRRPSPNVVQEEP